MAEKPRTLIVTGASRGIGAAISLLAAARGFAVAVSFSADEAGAALEPQALHGQGALMVQLKLADPLAPVVSVAVTVTLEVPPVVGVPEMRPVDELMDSPAGRPPAL